MTSYTPDKRHRVEDYKKYKPKENRYYFESNIEIKKITKPLLIINPFFHNECSLIFNKSNSLEYKKISSINSIDILFEYLVIRAVSLLEICLKAFCCIYVEKFPSQAGKLLTNIDNKKDLSLQIISNYSFSNLSDIEHVFSTLWGKKYFQVLRLLSEESQSNIGYERARLHRASPLFKKMGMIKQLFKLRNELIHENKHIKIKHKRVKKNLLTVIYDIVFLTELEQFYH